MFGEWPILASNFKAGRRRSDARRDGAWRNGALREGVRLNRQQRLRVRCAGWLALLASALLAGCASEPEYQPPSLTPEQAQALIASLLPKQVRDRDGWALDIQSAFQAQSVVPSRENACAVIAVIEQESGFQVNPVVPGLPQIAWREIDRRAEAAGIPLFLVHGALRLSAASGKSFGDRIDHVRTEKDLSDIYEDIIGMVPMGKRLFAERNPVHTRGPMQVNVSFAQSYTAEHPYPYPLQSSLADELFTRRGSVYFGIAHLFGYSPPYDSLLYRFADYNAGQFASRNAAFQRALGRLANMRLTPDGALLARDASVKGAGSTARAAHGLAQRLQLDDREIDAALAQAHRRDFERTELYRRVFAAAELAAGRPVVRAFVPQIELHGAKLSHALSTDWYAHRVNGRFQRCLAPRP